jgi:DNA-binding CsgD family transcriptional regulator
MTTTRHAREVALWAARVRKATDRRDAAVAGRDAAIVRMRRDGATLQEIAAVAGLTHPAVRTICLRSDPPDQPEGDQS